MLPWIGGRMNWGRFTRGKRETARSQNCSTPSEVQHSLHRSGETSPPRGRVHCSSVLASGTGSHGEAPWNDLVRVVTCKGSTPCVQPLGDDLAMLASQANCRHASHQTHGTPAPETIKHATPPVSMQAVVPAGKAHPGSRRCQLRSEAMST